MATYLKCKIQHNNYNEASPENQIVVSFLPGQFINDHLLFDDQLQFKLNGHIYQRNLLFLENEVLFNRIRKYWKCIENLVLIGQATMNNIANIKEVINLLSFTYYNLQESKDKELQVNTLKYVTLFRNSMLKISEIDDDNLNKLTSNIIVIEEEPISQYFHNYFAVFYLILLIEKTCASSEFLNTYESVILDLVKLSETIYEKNRKEILYIQPFPCFCIKDFWMYLLRNPPPYSLFWTSFNKCLDRQSEEFSLWLLQHVSQVQYFNVNRAFDNRIIKEENVNIDLVNKILQSAISQMCSDQKLFNILKLLNPIFTELWLENMKLDPYQILWDYFYKSFSNPIQNMHLPKSICEFKDSIDNIINNPDALRNPYEYFLYLLYKHLDKHPLHWKKLQGRIYSRLPEHKMKDFQDPVIYNISLLFFTLASLKIQEILEKLSNILENLPGDRHNTEFMWILHINMVNVAIAQNQDIRNISSTLQKLVTTCCENQENFRLMKHFLQGLSIIFNNCNFDLNQNCLLGSWIAPFMSACSHTDLCTVTQILITILKQAESVGKWNTVKPIYLEYVLPTLKQISLTSTVSQIGELAALILINTSDLNTSLLAYFCGETINVNVTNEFLSTILTDLPLTTMSTSQENALISAWCRICLLCNETISKDLCKKVFNLPVVRNVILIEDCNEPFVDFVKALSKQTVVPSQVFRLKELCEMCFGNIDRWITSYLTPSTAESQVLYLYTKISLLFYYCAPLLYQKSKSICLLNRLVTVLLLPTEILMGKPPPANILHAVERTWHLFMKGIYKLDHVSDPYIDRTLKDLIIRYIPHFSTITSPISNILDSNDITTYTLEKITNGFLLHSARSSEENTFKALRTINNILQISVDLSKVQNIVRKVLPGVFEVIMYNSQKSAALEVIKFITTSEWYSHIHGDIQISMQNITAKHLAFSTNNYFQLLSILQKFMPEDVQSSLPNIKEQIKHVERMRGVGFDNTLRQALKRIEESVS